MPPHKPKKTGLAAEPLLLRRTDEPQPPAEKIPQPPPQATPQETFHEADTPSELPAKRASTYRAVPRVKTTLFIDEDVHIQLGLAARVEGKQQSEIASEILRKHLPRYDIKRQR